jgi:PTS system nitrogen regulatory IIA component
MLIQSLLSPSRCLAQVEATSKKRVLELLAIAIAEDIPDLDAETIFLNLIGRERLGSTGIGFGVAIPHARVNNCQSPIGAVITLTSPIEFDAIDSLPVDIVFAMLVPDDANSEHLQYLAALAQGLNNNENREKIRAADDSQALFDAVKFSG